MARDTRDLMVLGAMDLLATNGLSGTSFSDVLEVTGAPRGSIYHHFPQGKDQLIAAAVDLTGDRYTAWMEQYRGASPERIIGGFLHIWRHTLASSDMMAGCPVLAVTVATDSEDLVAHARTVFRASHDQLTAMLVDAGAPDDQAASLATVAIAAAEGAVVLARAERSMHPFETVAAHLLDQAARLPRRTLAV